MLQLQAGLGHDRQRPESRPRRNSGEWMRLGASLALPLGFTVGASARWERTGYEGGDRGWPHYTDDDRRRRDSTRTLRLSALNRGFTLLGMSPRLALVNEVRRTNAQLQDYKRNRAELTFVRQF